MTGYFLYETTAALVRVSVKIQNTCAAFPKRMTDNKTSTEYSLATSAKDEPLGSDGFSNALRSGVKQGHKCCGGCCDVRRATIIVNLVQLGLLTFALLGIIVISKADLSTIEDETQRAAAEQAQQHAGLATGLTIVKMVFAGLGVYGAMSYNIYMVGASAVMYIVDCLMSLVVFQVASTLLAGFFAYPHIFFIKEVRDGTMTKKNYPVNEEHSCCCV